MRNKIVQNTSFHSRDIAYLVSIVKKAGELAHTIQKGRMEIKRKSDSSFVTQADIGVQKMLVSKIRKKFKEALIISEEEFDGSRHTAEPGTLTFIIDPIDGTAVFTMGLPTWCVSLGVFEGFVPRYGFVYSPASDIFFHNDDRGAYLNGKSVSVRHNAAIDSETNIFFASGIERLYKIDFPGKIRNLGSTALHAALGADNARNRTLAFIGSGNLWDWAGAIPVLQKAGGEVRYLSGRQIDYREVAENRCEFPEIMVAYTAAEFGPVRKIFVRIC